MSAGTDFQDSSLGMAIAALQEIFRKPAAFVGGARATAGRPPVNAFTTLEFAKSSAGGDQRTCLFFIPTLFASPRRHRTSRPRARKFRRFVETPAGGGEGGGGGGGDFRFCCGRSASQFFFDNGLPRVAFGICLARFLDVV